MPRYGGIPKPVVVRPANIAERKVTPTRKARQIIRGPLLRKPTKVAQPTPNPPPLPLAARVPTRNILPRKPITVAVGPQVVMRSGRSQPVVRERRSGRNIRPIHNDTIIRADINKIRELKQVGKDKVLVMVACGPSINEIPIEQLSGNPRIDIMSINKPDKRLWPTTYWAFCDMSQYNRNKELWDAFTGTIVNSSSVKVSHRKQVRIRTRSGQGFARDLTNGFYIGRSTTYANLQTALWMGYERIYLFGCDMGAVNGQMHFYGKNPDVSDDNRAERFAREAEHYQYAASTLLEEERHKFYFCSSHNKWPFVKAFNYRDHKTVIHEIIEYANNGTTKT